VPTEARTQVTELLDSAAAGDTLATDRLFPIVFDELRRMAAGLMDREREGGAGYTLQPTALVNEAFLRLVGRDLPWQSRAHFFGAAALAMRRILIDRARHVRATRPKSGPLPPDSMLPTLGDSGAASPQANAADDLIALDDALTALHDRDPRQHDVVMLRFFAGLSVEQTAEALGLSASTVKNEWAWARARLMREIESSRSR
jgi:RNA polymerase sigma factor (TIGR02999 family)